MLRSTKNTNGVISLTFAQIGIFIATGILLVVVFSFVFDTTWQKIEDMRSTAQSFSSFLRDMDLRFFENTTLFQFPKKNYAYDIALSSEYLHISTKGNWGEEVSITEHLLIFPWIRSSEQNWTTGQDLHAYLNRTTNHEGTEYDPLSSDNFSSLNQEQNSSKAFFAHHPIKVLCHKPVFVEKVTIFYDTMKKHDFLLVYQLL